MIDQELYNMAEERMKTCLYFKDRSSLLHGLLCFYVNSDPDDLRDLHEKKKLSGVLNVICAGDVFVNPANDEEFEVMGSRKDQVSLWDRTREQMIVSSRDKILKTLVKI